MDYRNIRKQGAIWTEGDEISSEQFQHVVSQTEKECKKFAEKNKSVYDSMVVKVNSPRHENPCNVFDGHDLSTLAGMLGCGSVESEPFVDCCKVIGGFIHMERKMHHAERKRHNQQDHRKSSNEESDESVVGRYLALIDLHAHALYIYVWYS